VPPPRYVSEEPSTIPPSPPRRINTAIPQSASPINDRLYGETAMLMDLPEPDQIWTRNRDIPPLRGQELVDALKDLDSIRGLSGQQLWRVMDKCDCDQWFTKRTLHDEHSKICACWTLPPGDPRLANVPSPSTSSIDVERSLLQSPSRASPAKRLQPPAQLTTQDPPSPIPEASSKRPHLGRSQQTRTSHLPSPSPLRTRVVMPDSVEGLPTPSWLARPRNSLPSRQEASSDVPRDAMLTPSFPGAASLSTSSGSVSGSTSLSFSPDTTSLSSGSSMAVQASSGSRSPYPTGPHPSPITPPTHSSEPLEDDGSDLDLSQGSAHMHTIKDDILNVFLDNVNFNNMGTDLHAGPSHHSRH
jgi:hypothetical protein